MNKSVQSQEIIDYTACFSLVPYTFLFHSYDLLTSFPVLFVLTQHKFLTCLSFNIPLTSQSSVVHISKLDTSLNKAFPTTQFS